MNMINEVRAFDYSIELNQLSTGQIALWYALININNRCAWIEWFAVSSTMLQLKTGLSRRGIYDARNVLKQRGYIDFKETGNGKAAKYKLLTLSQFAQVTAQDTAQVALQVTAQDTAQVTAPLNKLNETKLNNKKDTNVSKKTFTPPTVEEVRTYCLERGNAVDADKWHSFYSAKGWLVGKNKMVDWKAAIRTWEEKPKKKERILT